MTSIVDDSLAVRAGLRNPVQTTMWPRRTRSVAIASAVRTENDSKVISSVGSGTVWKWSKTQSDSKPSASACSGELDRPGPGVGGVPAVVLALPALGHHQTRPASASSCARRARMVTRPAPGRASPMRVASRRAVAWPRAGRPGLSSVLDGRPTDDRFDPDRAPARPARPVGLDRSAEPALRPAVSHDRHDRGRARARRPGPRRARPAPTGRRRRLATAIADDGPRRAADRRDRLRHLRARRARRRRDPARGGVGPRACRGPGPVAAQAFELVARPAVATGWSSASRTRAARPPRTPRSPPAARPGRGPRSSPSRADRRARRSPTSSSRPRSSTRAGATRSAT